MWRFSLPQCLLLVTCTLSVESRMAGQPTQLPGLSVTSPSVPGENKIVGTYAQPEWSARRPFPGVSVYVPPAEQFEFETGFEDVTVSSGAHHREWTQEFEAGLGHRWQAAVENSYANFREDDRSTRGWRNDSVKLSTRYALADWGKLPLNPALGVGWRFSAGGNDSVLGQLVLGAELTPRWHWAADLQDEHRTGSPRLHAWAVATALTFSVTNETLNIGLQGQCKNSTEGAEATLARNELGPCIQYRPIDQLHFDCVALLGTEHGRAVHTLSVFAGFEFGKGADDHDDDRERGGRLTR